MEHIELEVLIQAPAQKVWDGITNWHAQSQWMLGTKVWPVDGDGTGVGGKIEAFTGIWRIGFLDTMEITAWDPPRLCDVNHTGRVVRGTGTFEVVATSESTSKFIWSESIDLPLGLFGKFGWFFIKPFFASGIKYSLNKFALTFAQSDPK